MAKERLKSMKSYKSTIDDYIGKEVYHVSMATVTPLIMEGSTKQYIKSNLGMKNLGSVYPDLKTAETKALRNIIENLGEHFRLDITKFVNISSNLLEKYPEELL